MQKIVFLWKVYVQMLLQDRVAYVLKNFQNGKQPNGLR